MERGQLEHFVAIVEHGGFTAAAAAIHLSQPALSHSVKALERDLGVMLFFRLPHGVKLTPAGTALAESARRILREMAVARSRVQAVEDLVLGTLDIIALPGLLLDPLAAFIGTFRDHHPAVLIRVLHAEGPSDVTDGIRSGRAELGLTDDVVNLPATTEYDVVTEQEFVVVAPENHSQLAKLDSVDVETLLKMDLVTGPQGTDVRDFLQNTAAQLNTNFQPTVEVAHRGSSLYLATAGAGVAILPRPLAELGLAHGARVLELKPRRVRSVYLLRRDALLSPAARAMREVIKPDAELAEG